MANDNADYFFRIFRLKFTRDKMKEESVLHCPFNIISR
jgi:hypothetical protein